VSIEGPGDIMGPRLIPLIGGVAAFWVRSGVEAGEILLQARGSRFTSTARIGCRLSEGR